MAPIKVGVVGYGKSARIYQLPYIVPNNDFQVIAFLQRSPAPGDSSLQYESPHCTINFPDARHYQTPDTFFADQEIELVIVTTPADSHAEFASLSLRAGKHVVVEKPFTTTSAEADKLLALSKETGKLIFPYQNRRWDGDFVTVQKLLQAKVLGKINEVEIHYDMNLPADLKIWPDEQYKAGDGMMFGLGSHTLDQAIELFGNPKTVTAFLRALRGIKSQIEDTFTVLLEYGSPLLVTVKTTHASPMKHQLKFFIRGENGSFVKYGTDPQENQTLSGVKTTDPSFGFDTEEEWGTIVTCEKVALDGLTQEFDTGSKLWVGKVKSSRGWNRGFYEHVKAVLRDNAETIVSAKQSRDVIKLIELARESAEKKCTISWVP